MTLRVEFTRRAARDIAERYDRMAVWATRAAADRWRDSLLAAVYALAHSPEQHPEAPEAEWLDAGVRELLHGKRRFVHRVLFEVRAEVVLVLHVRNAREDYVRPGDL